MTGPAKILAVDDEADFELLIRQQFRRQIRTQEYAFSFARHGEEALAALAADPEIELLLLDINMPVMDGLTLLSMLQERQSPVRAVIVSAYGDMANIRTAMNRGAFDFVTKPVDLKDLEITIRKTLGDIARVRELERRRAAAERARTNLARYFSPNLVGLLADRDEPLGPVRRETVAVLFVDIVGFTRMAEKMAPEAVVTMLRVDALKGWNAERAARDEAALAVGIGLNYGPAVLGDVGSDQGLSFTVIGDTVNIANRLQMLTRSLQTPLVVADSVITGLDGRHSSELGTMLARLRDQGEQTLRGRFGTVRIWTSFA